MPLSIVYPVHINIHDVIATIYNRSSMDVSEQKDFERNCVYLSKGVLDYDFLSRSYQRSDSILMIHGYVYELVSEDGQRYSIEQTKIMLGIATMYRQRFAEFLRENKRVTNMTCLSNPLNTKACMYVMHIHAMATRYFLGKEMLRVIEELCQANQCDMMVVRTVPSSFMFYIKHGFVRSNDWLMLYPLNNHCPWMYIHDPKHVSWHVALDVMFEGDGMEQGFLLTKYIGKDATTMCEAIRHLQRGGHCCMKYLK